MAPALHVRRLLASIWTSRGSHGRLLAGSVAHICNDPDPIFPFPLHVHIYALPSAHHCDPPNPGWDGHDEKNHWITNTLTPCLGAHAHYAVIRRILNDRLTRQRNHGFLTNGYICMGYVGTQDMTPLTVHTSTLGTFLHGSIRG